MGFPKGLAVMLRKATPATAILASNSRRDVNMSGNLSHAVRFPDLPAEIAETPVDKPRSNLCNRKVLLER
jgi:hypothetical protein